VLIEPKVVYQHHWRRTCLPWGTNRTERSGANRPNEQTTQPRLRSSLNWTLFWS